MTPIWRFDTVTAANRWVFMFLILLGLMGNYFSFPLFFGVDFLFGSIATLIVLTFFGLGWGLVSATIVSSYTFFLWGHPYAIVIFGLEVLIVGYLLAKTKRSLLQCAGIFWFFFGVPAVFLFYKVVMHMDLVATSVIMLKQCVNGIFNALIANMIVNLSLLNKFIKNSDQHRTIPLREILFNLMIAMVLFSVLAVMVLEGRSAMGNMQRGIAANMKTLSADMSWHLRLWFQQHLHAVIQLAAHAGENPSRGSPQLQSKTETVTKLFPAFHNMYVADEKGTTIAFYPPVNAKGESTIGLNFADRDYFQNLRHTHRPVLSKVFLGRGGVFSPIVTLSAPVLKADRFLGFALGALDLSRIRKVIELYGGDGKYKLTLTDASKHVIASNLAELEFMQVYERKQRGTLKTFGDSFYQWLPADKSLPAMTRFKKSFYFQETTISDDVNWKLIVQYPVAWQQNYLYMLYIRYLSILIVLVVVAFAVASFISTRLARPLTELADLTADLPDAHTAATSKPHVVSRSSVTEISSLIQNFGSMAHLIDKNFTALHLGRRELEQINTQLKIKVDELEHAKEAVHESEAKALSILNAITETVMLVDTEGVVLSANQVAAQRLATPHDALIGRSLRGLLSHTDGTREMNAVRRVTATFEAYRTEYESNGKIYDFNWYPVFNRWGEVTQIAVFGADITDKRQLETRLQRVQKMEAIGTLAGGVAHDLNNILSGIVTYPELLLLDLAADSPLRASILAIRDSGQRAAAVVQDLLTLARRGIAVTETVNLNQVIQEYLHSPEFEKLHSLHPAIEVEADCRENLLNIKGSPVHLSKTVMNIIQNAVEAMPDGGKCIVSTTNQYIDAPIRGYDEVQEGDYVVLTCRDTGIGIPQEDLERIFEPFYTKKVMGRSGTGLGMAVVWGTVKDHQGYIEIESTHGKGTTIKLYFPVTRKELAVDKSFPAVEHYTGNGETVLVVDDIQEQRKIATMLLHKLGYTVTAVASGDEAVAYMQKNCADLIVLDMIMDPGMDGLETYKQIIRLHPHQKAIITSGFSETERVKEAEALGVAQYLKKPYTLEKMGLAVKAALQKRDFAKRGPKDR